MKKKLNLSNAMENAELLEEQILKRERHDYIKAGIRFFDERYYRNTDHYKIISRTLRSSVGKNWNEVREHLRSKIPEQYHYRIDRSVWYKNRNGDMVDELGRIKKLLPTCKTTGYTKRIDYYIEDNIIKIHRPYVKFPKERQYKIIKKKEKPVEKKYVFSFDYDIIDDWSGNIKEFLKLLESNKKTYRVRRLDTVYGNLRYHTPVKKWERETRKEFVITHIKTHYD